MLFVLTILTLTVLCFLLMERLVEPKSHRPFFHRVSLLAATPVVVFFLSLFMLSYRVLFSSALTLVVFLVIIIVNNAKVRILREPLVHSDFALLRQVIRHPRLYISYIGPVKLLGAVTAGAAVVGSALVFEPPVIMRSGFMDFVPTMIFFFVVFGLIYAITRGPLRDTFLRLLNRFGPSANVDEDVDKLSLVVCLIFYFFLARGDLGDVGNVDISSEDLPRPPRGSRKHMPDVVAVQSESFFDARSVLARPVAGFLAEYDRIGGEAQFRGRLSVPAWGANTLRTEYAFLSGVPVQALGVHQYHPFLTVGRRPQWTLANFLREQGYRTICIHPYHKSFFGRDEVYPNLGFDEFLDISEFEGAPRSGPYVSDMAVAEKVRGILSESEQPVFVFVITMENHGQWDKDRIEIDEEIRAASPAGSEEFACYLQHLTNADRMIAAIGDTLERREQEGVFCFFGDHQPSFPKVFAHIGHDDIHTDYFIWKKGMTGNVTTDIEVHSLGRLMLEVIFLADLEGREAKASGPAD